MDNLHQVCRHSVVISWPLTHLDQDNWLYAFNQIFHKKRALWNISCSQSCQSHFQTFHVPEVGHQLQNDVRGVVPLSAFECIPYWHYAEW